MQQRALVILLSFGPALAGGAVGCGGQTPTVGPPAPTVVPVSQPVQREVTDFVDFTGRTDAVDAVSIRARVTGYLVKMPFKEGAEVKKGDLLFEIDPRPYKAQLDQAKSQVALYAAQLALAKTTYERDRGAGPVAVPLQQLDQDRAAIEEAAAQINAAKASVEVYKLNLDFTQVASPINGKVSRFYLTLGNLVNQDQTLLTTVVSLDPMYAYFDMDESTLLRIRRAINQGRIKPPRSGKIPVYMGLQGEEDYPHLGHINFVNNQVNPTTGSISVRGVFPNPQPRDDALAEIATSALGWAGSPLGPGPVLAASLAVVPGNIPEGTRLLSPGMFVRIRLPIGQPHPALLVIDRAIGSDQDRKFVYVLDKNNKLQQRPVTIGALQEDGLRVIEPGEQPDEGIRKDDWVVVGAIVQVRPRMTVEPERIPMPTLGRGTADTTTPVISSPPASSRQRKTRR
jgi:multidrug efflux system membrane fusion protein